MVNEYGWKWYHRGYKPQGLYYEPQGLCHEPPGAVLGATWAILWAGGGPASRLVTFKKKVFNFICVLPTKVARDGPGLMRERRGDDYSPWNRAQTKSTNSKTQIKANEYFRDFHTSHAECPKKFGTDGREEVETLYIRSSMEEDRAYW